MLHHYKDSFQDWLQLCYDNFIYIHFLKHPHHLVCMCKLPVCLGSSLGGARDVEQEIVKVSMLLCPTVMQICDGL